MGKVKKMVCIIFMFCGLMGCSRVYNVNQVENRIEEYMRAVYAPDSMKQFKDAREKSDDIFTDNVIARFFVSYADELSEADLLRSCDLVISHGEAKNQSDGIERYLVKAYLYEDKYADPILRYFTFYVNEDNKIYDYTIETKEEWESEVGR